MMHHGNSSPFARSLWPIHNQSSRFDAAMSFLKFGWLPSAFHHDFCPWANAYVYWLKRPIGWVVLAFASSLLLGIYVSPQAFTASGAIAAVGIIGSLWPWISTLGLKGELAWSPSRCEQFDTIETALTVTNRWPWPVWGMVLESDDAISGTCGDQKVRVSLSRIPGLSKSQFRWNCSPAFRGIYPKNSPRLSTAFPFGIWSCNQPLQVAESLVVWPRLTRLVDVPSNAGNHVLGIGGTSDRSGDDGDWIGVRAYRPGDSLRQVHWAQTARRDNLVVFERQSRSQQSVRIQLDSSAFAEDTPCINDAMVRVYASIANHFLSHAWNTLVAIDAPWTSLHAFNRTAWLDQLAGWEPVHGPKTAPATLPPIAKNQSLSILITSARHSNHSDPRSSQESMPSRFVLSVDDAPANLSTSGDWSNDHPNVWTISTGDNFEESLRHVWREICQANLAHGAACVS